MDLSTLHLLQFKWQEIHQKAFDSMIDALQKNTSLNLPDPTKPFLYKLMLPTLPELEEYSRKTTKAMNC